MKNIVFVTDIFGESSWTDNFSTSFSDSAEFHVISPYSTRLDLADEKDAYQAFTVSGGIEAYVSKVKARLFSMPKEHTLFIGFSAGAAALWKVLADNNVANENSHFIGLYPGQIRHYLDLEPQIDTSLIFPISEQHFDLTPVLSSLRGKANTRIWQNALQHGFVNPSSDNFHLQASQEVVGWCQNKDKLFTANAFSQLLKTSQLNYQRLN